VAGLQIAAKQRPIAGEQLEAIAIEVEESVRLDGPEVTTVQIGQAVLGHLRQLDEIAYLRFASVHKDFGDVRDFERELQILADRPN
jgi:transcriptional repressor NrdR